MKGHIHASCPKSVWQKLGSPELLPSAITLRAYDGRPSSPEGLFQNVPIELGGKTILIDIEVIDAPTRLQYLSWPYLHVCYEGSSIIHLSENHVPPQREDSDR
jgi:hypothetical protein